ncbi:SDR family NAD(P)-dependent oxidoreductase [Streptomyces sp. NPDC050560]|uniref:SDR family NAD(P)-dependent oxidoreductase n=1 Tax=Streptomyces sp. NPDC050560 TaxID=3365630 RepID=UPI003788EF75
MGPMEGKTAVVTGASSGIGRAIAARFVGDGARVYLTGRRAAPLRAVADELGENAVAVPCDVASAADLERLFDTVRADRRTLDVVVANAGVGRHGRLGDITEEAIDYTFGVNVKGVIFTVQGALALLAPDASVILVGSTTSVRPDPRMAVYGATKAAVRNLARSWAQHAQGQGFRVNVLSPGPTATPGLERVLDGDVDALNDAIPLGRPGRPEEIAAVAAFLASDASSFVNGVELFADGGHAQI